MRQNDFNLIQSKGGRSFQLLLGGREKSEEATTIFRAITRERRGARGPFRMGFVQDAMIVSKFHILETSVQEFGWESTKTQQKIWNKCSDVSSRERENN